MSEEKVLTLRGRKAYWGPVPEGGGGGYVLKIDPSEHTMDSGGLTVESIDYTPLYKALCQGQSAVIVLTGNGAPDLPMPVFRVELVGNGYGGQALVVNGTYGYIPVTFINGSVS